VAKKRLLNRVKHRLLAYLYGNAYGQRILDRRIRKLQRYQGVGCGAGLWESGESKVIKMLKEEKRQGHICIFDVGANKGEYARMVLSMLACNEKKVAIHCFEPSKFTYDLLKQNLSSQVVTFNNVALGKEIGEAYLYYDEPGSGLASLTKRDLDYLGVEFGHHERVYVDTVDNYCRKNGIGFIDLLKIDVEGHDLDVLQGATGMFTKKAIRMVTFEFGGCNIDTRTFFKDFFYFFRKHHYKVYRITPSGYLFEIDSYKEKYEQFRTTNFLAILKS